MNATLFVMFTGVSWQMLPRKYPSYQTCHRCFKAWYDAGVMHKVAAILFGHESPDFLGLVAARVRIALRETRGGVDRAVKRTDTGSVKNAHARKPVSAVVASSKRGTATKSSARPKPVVAVEQARVKRAATPTGRAAGKLPTDGLAKKAVKPRAIAPLKSVSKAPTKVSTEGAVNRAIKGTTNGSRNAPSKARADAPPTPADIAANAVRATVIGLAVQAAAKRKVPSKSAKAIAAVTLVKSGKSTSGVSGAKGVKSAMRVAAELSPSPSKSASKRAEKAAPKPLGTRAEKPTPTLKSALKRASNRGTVSRERAVVARPEVVRSVPSGTHAVGSRPLKAEPEALQAVGRGKAGERRATKAVAA